MPHPVVVLYELEGDIDNDLGDCLYYGLAGIVAKQSTDQALNIRSRYLQMYPKACLNDVPEFKLTALAVLSLQDGLVEEAPELIGPIFYFSWSLFFG